MDRALWEKHLALAEEHVVMAEHVVRRQQDIIAELERDGHSTHMARRILNAYQELLQLHIHDRDRLKADLANASARPDWPPLGRT